MHQQTLEMTEDQSKHGFKNFKIKFDYGTNFREQMKIAMLMEKENK